MMIREEFGSTAMARSGARDRRTAPGGRRHQGCSGGSAIRPVSHDSRRASQPWTVASPGLSSVIDRCLAGTDRHHADPNAGGLTFAIAGATLAGTARSGVTEPSSGPT